SLSLSCEGQSDSAGWRLRRYTHSWGVSGCSDWGSVTGSTCTIRYLYTSHTGVYWCQSVSGGNSNPVNITVHNGGVILESPVHPVTEGDPLILRCLLHLTIASDFRADFYKDGILIQNQTRGEMTIHSVSKSDEGLYQCKNSERRESPYSWVSVRGKKAIKYCVCVFVCVSGQSHSKTPFSVLGLLSSLLAVSPYLLVSIILGAKCYRARSKNCSSLAEHITHVVHKITKSPNIYRFKYILFLATEISLPQLVKCESQRDKQTSQMQQCLCAFGH
uniref:Ig-like domain-containing protein n=1 Tax=Electrophorus electricus TaxID=8005 RepID=A0A4W4F593_ELEEL